MAMQERPAQDASVEGRLLTTLERLLEIQSVDLGDALSKAADLVAEALGADKVDVFVLDPARASLVALGTSRQPLSAQQRRLGLDVLQIANGGRAVQVFTTGETFVSGRADQDADELLGIKQGLGVKSSLGVALDVTGARRGVLLISSLAADRFSASDARFAEAVARWIGVLTHRAELVAATTQGAMDEGRRVAAEELVTVLAHDFRNYLTPLRARVDLLRRRAEREQRARDLRDTAHALLALERLSGLVMDMLDVARIDQGLMHLMPEPLELRSFLEETAAGLSTPAHPIEVCPYEEVVVSADPARLRQCVGNLLSNAVAHSPEGAAVQIDLMVVDSEGGPCAVVHIADQGPGVPPEVLPRLFERFAPGPDSRGLGLGLHLAKRIAVLHGGDLTVTSHPGHGTRLELRVPTHMGA